MANPLKREVLQAFKNLHRARLTVFKGDERVLKDCRNKINEEFKKNKAVSDSSAIHDMLALANGVAKELRTTIVQAEEKAPGVFELHIRPEVKKLDNMPFNPDIEIPKRRGSRKEEPSPCCQETTPCCREIPTTTHVKSSSVK